MKNNFQRLTFGSTKAPSPSSVVVVNKTDDATANQRNNIAIVEKAIMDNDIVLKDTYRNKDDDLVIVCDSKKSRDTLNNLVNNADGNIATKTPRGKQPTISIVGLPREYIKEEITDMLIKQNEFVKRFAVANKIEDHFKVLVVRPTKNNQTKFQVFATVSTILRDGLKEHKDKLTIGLSTCKVYDQFYVKRCNKCQDFAYYSKNCNAEDNTCAKCGGNHSAYSCTSTNKKCINCVREGNVTQDHCAFDSICPAILKQQELVKKQFAKNSLNLSRYKAAQTT